MTDDTQALLRRIEALEARVSVLEQPKPKRTKRVKSTAGNINLDDDLFAPKAPVMHSQAATNDISFGAVDLLTLAYYS